MTQSYWQNFKLNTQTAQLKHYDFIIVGGGIAGLSTAYWLLQKDKNLKIGIIEKNFIGSGASGKNAGFVTCGSIEHFIKLKDQFGLIKALEIWKFSEMNRQLLKEHIIQDHADQMDFKQTGSCTVAPSDERLSYYKEIVNIMQAHDIDIVTAEQLTIEQDYGVTGFAGGAVYLNDGYVHPIKLLSQILSKINVYIHEQTQLLGVVKNTENYSVKTTKGEFTADQIIMTANAYLPLVNPKFSSLIVPGRGQILLTKSLQQFVKGPCYLTKHLCYFRQLPTGELLIGGFRNRDSENEKTLEDLITVKIQTALFDFVKNHFKFGLKAEIAYQWSGIMGYTPDGQMLIGSLNDDKNIYYLAGCSGHGMGLNFNGAKTLVESVFGKDIPKHLDVKRFVVLS